MNNLLLKERKIIENNAVIAEEELGTAQELIPGRLTSLTDSVRSEVQKLSILEVIA